MTNEGSYPNERSESCGTVHYPEDTSLLDKLTSMNMQPPKIKRDFAAEFTEWYQRVINRAFLIVEEWEKKSGLSHTCHQGCNSCCYHLVEIYDYELFAIITYLKKTNQEHLMNSAVHIAEIIEQKLCIPEINETIPDESNFIDLKMKYRSLQIPCLFQKDKKCAIYEVRPTCCVTYYSYGPYEDCAKVQSEPQYSINYGSIEDWIIEQISSFLDYNRKKVPKGFDPFNLSVLPISIRDNYAGF